MSTSMILIICVVPGIAIIGFLAVLAVRAINSKAWPTTVGVIVDKGTKEHLSSSRNSETGHIQTTKSIHIKALYSYSVDGKPYMGTRVTFSDIVNKTTGSLNKLLKERLDSDVLQVYYNPKNPADSVLIPGASIYNFTPMITGFLFIGAGVFWYMNGA